MKTRNDFKKVFIGAAFITLVVWGLSSCNNNQKTKDTKDAAEDRNNEVINDKAQERDAQFLVDAAAISIEEIQLGQLAQTKSTDKEVKKIGKMMEDDHTKSLNELKELASKKGIAIPTSLTKDGQDAYNELNDKKENDFNEDYCEKMVKGHKDAISKFEKAATDAEDQDIKTWAAAMLPKLRMHLDNANVCESKEDKKAASIVK